MYPNFYYIFKEWFGLELEFLKLINSFGFFVAISFLLANLIMSIELKRKFKLGLLGNGPQIKYNLGASFPLSDYISSGVTGFIFGYKFLPLLLNFSLANNDPQSYILSLKGSFLYGFILMIISLGLTFYQDKKQRLSEPKEETKTVDHSHFMGEFTFAAFIGGILGAKLFHIFENWSESVKDIVGALMSFSGLTYYGGLILGAVAVLYFAKKRGVPFLHMLDVGAPAMMLAYGVGRIGCHVSGDGDWGIVNTMAKPKFLSFLPDWAWAYNYPNNVNKVCNPYIEGSKEYLENLYCNFEQTPYLIAPVFPTPFYEAVMCIVLFFLLWFLRKKIKYAGLLFGIYLIFNGLERFFIEKIRVNNPFLMSYTQAEVISSILVLLGIFLCVYSFKKKQPALN